MIANEPHWREVLRAQLHPHRTVARRGVRLSIETIDGSAIPTVAAVFGAAEPLLGFIECPHCSELHSHRVPYFSPPMYLKAPCSSSETPLFYVLRLATMREVRRALAPRAERAGA